MIQDILFRGYTTTPPELVCPDGELLFSESLSNDGSGLSPILPPSEIASLSPNDDILFMHQVPNQKNLILWSGGELFWLPYNELHQAGSRRLPLGVSADGVKQVLAVGNVLMVLKDSCIEYLLWTNGGYKVLGNHFPEVRLSFGLKGDWTFRLQSLDLTKSGLNHAMAEAVKMVAEEGVEKGRFIYPFFVRYALRLYDGSLVHHSAPILMQTTSGVMPIISEDGKSMSCLSHSLQLVSVTNISELERWSDIIKGVDVFVSKGVPTFDQNGQDYSELSDDRWLGERTSNVNGGLFGNIAYNTIPVKMFGGKEGKKQLPAFDEKYIGEQLSSTSTFYYLTSFTIADLKRGKQDIGIPRDYLRSLVNRETMTDDYDSHDTLCPSVGFAFNSRLNLSGLKKHLFRGFGWERAYEDQALLTSSSQREGYEHTEVFSPSKVYRMHIDYYIRENGREYEFEVDCGSVTSDMPLPYLYHPNRNAYKAVVTVRHGDAQNFAMTVSMYGHPFLNGSYAWLGFDCKIKSEKHFKVGAQTITNTDDLVELSNKLYTSEVNNPFFFEAGRINTLGGGEIIGLSAAVRALSEGQYGQFPVYAFTTEGVWALQTLSNGALSAKQPVCRDVCTNPESITQIDDAVLFVSERGLMLLSGSNCVCISDAIFSRKRRGLFGLPKLELLLRKNNEDVVSSLPTIEPLLDYLKTARILYDYVNQRIIVFQPATSEEKHQAYVYSLSSRQWSFLGHELTRPIKLYPYALAMDRRGKILDYGKPQLNADGSNPASGVGSRAELKPSNGGKVGVATPIMVGGWFVTRALKLGAGEILKTIRTLIVRGSFERGAVRVMLWGSRDLRNWFAIAASADGTIRGISGTPYKYFRLGVKCDLGAEDYVTGCTIEFEPRHRDRLR
jgi:hypothetical protein|nr:MAG TPA: hypothetical protein [Caudoviricetes sp.]